MQSSALLSLIFACYTAIAQVDNGRFRHSRNRIAPYDSSSDISTFGLLPGMKTNPSQSRSLLIPPPRVRQGRLFGRRGLRGHKRRLFGLLGPASALRARDDGAIDFSNGVNSILKGKPKKPTKAPPINTNQIDAQVDEIINNKSTYPVEKVDSHNTAILHCTFDSNIEQIGSYRSAQIWWTKQPERAGDRPVIIAAGTQIRIPDDRLRVVTFPDSSFSVLIIRNAIHEDAGTYKCSLPSITGTKTSFTKLLVQQSPKDSISTSPKENNLKEGETLRLFCQPQGYSHNVWWSAKTEKGANIDLYPGRQRVNGEVLTIPALTKSHEGVYTCHVEGVSNQPIKQHFNVQVKEKPWDITGYLNGFRLDGVNSGDRSTYGQDVTLRCDTGGVPSPYIQWYRNGQPIINNYKYKFESYEPSFKQNGVISQLVISGFQRYDEGSYSCKAYNDIGLKQLTFDVQGKSQPVPVDDEDDSPSGRRYRILDGSGDDGY